jgi:HAD superfamily hydrolase (TIGR01484 family)
MQRLLLCTDLDRTLLPNGSQPESPGARRAFARLAGHPSVHTVYVTGRDADLVDDAIASWAIPEPDLLIADVGTTIASPSGAGWMRWEAWDERLAAAWADRSSAEIASLVGEVAGLRLQDPSRQKTFKRSWFTLAGAAGRQTAAEVRRRLAEDRIGANVIWSEDETTGEGLLDVLPAVATKRLALEFVISSWNYERDEVIFAGDSGNDLDVLASAIPAVLVANADPAVRDEARRRAAEAGHEDRLYCADGALPGLNGNYAAGILEGVLHFHPEWSAFMAGEQ